MIDSMNDRLFRWARWAASGKKVVGLGFARCALVERTSRPAGDPFFDEEASDTDSAIVHLPDQLRSVVMAHYLDNGTVAQKCRDCGCCRETYYDRLHHAHVRLGSLCQEVRDARCRLSGSEMVKKTA